MAFSIGGLDIVWYGVAWTTALAVALYLWYKIIRREGLPERMVESGFFYVAIAGIIGARLGHCLFYEPGEFFLDPFQPEFPWIKLLNFRGGGMASHGAALGMLVGCWLFVRKWKVPFVWMLDRMAVMVPLGGAILRLGNLINSEIYGKATDLPWGFIFVNDRQTAPMHPTQIYEALAYTAIFLLMAHLYWKTKAGDRRGFLFGLFLVLLFGVRFLIEFVKMPQPEEVAMAWGLNMGQWLSVPFIVAGLVILGRALGRGLEPYISMPREKRAKKKK